MTKIISKNKRQNGKVPLKGVGSLFIRAESLKTPNDKEPTAPSFETTRRMAVVSRVAPVINAPFGKPRVALLPKEWRIFEKSFLSCIFCPDRTSKIKWGIVGPLLNPPCGAPLYQPHRWASHGRVVAPLHSYLEWIIRLTTQTPNASYSESTISRPASVLVLDWKTHLKQCPWPSLTSHYSSSI